MVFGRAFNTNINRAGQLRYATALFNIIQGTTVVIWTILVLLP